MANAEEKKSESSEQSKDSTNQEEQTETVSIKSKGELLYNVTIHAKHIDTVNIWQTGKPDPPPYAP